MGNNSRSLSVLIRLICILVSIYQLLIRPLLPRSCRFEPSCSDYAIESMLKHGFKKGGRLVVCRLLRCHPWHAGGHDPVPESLTSIRLN